MKVLISVYSCAPSLGSEPGVGWNAALQLSKYYEVWAITPTNNRTAIEAELAINRVPKLHFVYYDPLWSSVGLQGKKMEFHYYLWQIGAYFIARKLHREIGFDLAHHVTFVKYWAPSFIALLPIPFIWGPIGGGESVPKLFWQDFSFRGKVYEILRDLARWLGEHDPFVQLTARRSALAVATTHETAERLRRLEVENLHIFSQVGLSKQEIAYLQQYTEPNDSSVKFISLGRLLHWKGFHLGLQAFALAQLENAEYWIVGDGPERQSLEALARELGIVDKVYFWGMLPRSETLLKLKECQVMVHPSLHDSGGWVCLEAMASGKPVICLDLGGPATQVTQETGFKVPAIDPEQAVCRIADAMKCLAHDPELRTHMGQAGQRRVSTVYDWDVKGKFLSQIYETIFNKPD